LLGFPEQRKSRFDNLIGSSVETPPLDHGAAPVSSVGAIELPEVG
jgi:hypothetical protein